ncbi:hypothetical protein DCAR_0206332 [Daucus carota subsp. sativus]|uniref:Leucine zipper homeobox-associated domain-containing protein n=1 Tax=Daucus carota subsp. sativus TaxID=79200 RepID=A0A169WJR1_DAUCS|nr:hypothetical protein DCAR_0206332 [Daucus carota subsp. sativus]
MDSLEMSNLKSPAPQLERSTLKSTPRQLEAANRDYTVNGEVQDRNGRWLYTSTAPKPHNIDLTKKLNFDAYRFSISWSRIFPSITPYANLNHYHLPQALQEKYNGWLGHELVKDFADYEDFCFKTFGDRVKNWMTFKKYVPEHTEEEDWNSLGFCMICKLSYGFKTDESSLKTKQLEKDYDILKESYDKLEVDYDSLSKDNEK